MPELDLGSVIGPQGPKGDPGNQGTVGPRGPQGEQGDAGKDATINGVNALQISVGQGLKESQEGGTYSIAMGDEDYKNLQNANGAVRYDQAQTLTPAQQEQAQHNIGTTWPCNPNLLDNWYFGRPVNQRGQTEYTGNGYGVDRWQYGVDVIVKNKYVTLQAKGTFSQLFQPFELQLAGKTVTMSALINAHNNHLVGLLLYDYVNQKEYSPNFVITPTANQLVLVSTSFRVADNAPDKLNFIFYPDKSESGNQTVDIIAAKLELGPTQTLAHQENGVWALNEVPEYGEQLRRCQRYCRVYKAGEYLPCIAFALENGWYCCAMLPYEMRTTPANNMGSNISVTLEPVLGDTAVSTTLENYGTLNGVQILKFSKEGQAFKTTSYYRIKLNADFVLTADL